MTGAARTGERAERGWMLRTLENDALRLEVLAERGATIVSLRDARTGHELLWRPRWGIPHRDRIELPGSSEAVAMGHYAGGWNTLFPNAGAASTEHGVEWPMHGEVWLAPFDLERSDGCLEFRTVLVRSPFEFVRRIELEGDRVTVTESARNLGAASIEVIWNQHPAFGAPLLGPQARIRSTARVVHPDIGDPRAARGAEPPAWPLHHPPGEVPVDLGIPPAHGSGVSRRAFLGEFGDGPAMVAIENPSLRLAARVEWDPAEFPYAWYWLEAGGRPGFPWFGAEYVLGIEPCTSYPTGGIGAIRHATGTQLTIGPGETATRAVSVVVGAPGKP
ncbi:MAG: aldose 1-epimerase [Microbacteriaceae bacterium]|nr:aldose 1-epimerase [Microbacteriaceae bacterium]